ncbi:MAG: ferredoxin reductase family protein [Rhizobiaceae bacterium]|nr:ferredoxin reductase family protein [Rhizobiaceae bacterium]
MRRPLKPFVLAVFYILVVMLPLAVAWTGAYPPRSFWNELATGAGLLAFAIILIEFILSGRFRSVSGRTGMDVTMRFHQLLARTALALALIHPFLYRGLFGYQRPWDVTRQLTLTTDFTALTTGLVTWILLPAFVFLSIARDQLPYKYETWRWMHGLGALAIAGFGLHHTLHAGRYSQDPILGFVWMAMFAIAVASLLYVYLAEPILQRRRPWRVASVRPVALKTWELSLQPQGHTGLCFQAGQFAWLNIGHSPFSLKENPFSISSAPAEDGRLQFVIKELGDFTSSVGQIKPGTKAYIQGPFGHLTVTDRNEPGIALIAGGVGIAPLLGILRQLHRQNDGRPTTLVYGNRTEEQIAYRHELDALATDLGTTIAHVLSEPSATWSGATGIIDDRLIRSLFGSREHKDWLYVLCGPPAMMEAVEKALIALGIPSRNILSERFIYD